MEGSEPRAEVIDLTKSPPPLEPIVIQDSDDELPLPEPDTLTSNRSATRSKRSKPRRSRTNTANGLTPTPEDDNSETRTGRQSEQRRRREEGKGERRGERLGYGGDEATDGNTREKGELEERSGLSSKKKKKKKQKGKEEEITTDVPDDQLFFVDTEPAAILRAEDKKDAITPIASGSTLPSKPGPDSEASQLLLPAHVTVWDIDFGVDSAAPVDIIQATGHSSDTDSYIDYLDYDDDRPTQRYFDEQKTEESKPTSFVCKKCGVRDDHRTWECRTQICLTCGARDEHSTYSCPISKVCFTCNMKGHLNRDCPNRAIAHAMTMEKYHDCDRCGSRNHTTQECPTIWRQYVYVTEEERNETLRQREEVRLLGLGNGGEGYIAGDDWCYNCGGANHLGDDCEVVPHPHDFPGEPSAFSSYNTLSGPFSDAPPQVPRHRREFRDWENDNTTFSDRWGFDAPDKVGKQAKNKNRARLEQQTQEMEQDDPDDWFGNPRNARNRGASSSTPTGPRERSKSGPGRLGGGGRALGPGPAPSKKMTFGSIKGGFGQKQAATDSSSRARDHSAKSDNGRNNRPSLLDRMGLDDDGGELRIKGASEKRKYDRHRDEDRDSYKDHDRRDRDRDRRRDWDSEYERNRDGDRYRHRDSGYSGRRDDRGPRYKGGYSR